MLARKKRDTVIKDIITKILYNIIRNTISSSSILIFLLVTDHFHLYNIELCNNTVLPIIYYFNNTVLPILTTNTIRNKIFGGPEGLDITHKDVERKLEKKKCKFSKSSYKLKKRRMQILVPTVYPMRASICK